MVKHVTFIYSTAPAANLSKTDNPNPHLPHLGINDDDEYEELFNYVPLWASGKAKTAVAATSDWRDIEQRADISKLSHGAERGLDWALIELRPEYAHRPNAGHIANGKQRIQFDRVAEPLERHMVPVLAVIGASELQKGTLLGGMHISERNLAEILPGMVSDHGSWRYVNVMCSITDNTNSSS